MKALTINDPCFLGMLNQAGPFVAVTTNGKIIASPEGKTWVQKFATGRSFALSDCNWGGGQFVAISGGSTAYSYTSSDTNAWDESPMPTGSWSRLGYGNGRFMAIEYGGRCITSDTGKTWTSVGTIDASIGAILNLKFGAGLFVVLCACEDPEFGSRYRIYSSPDGGSWTLRYDTDGLLYCIAFGAGKWLSRISNSNTAFISADLQSWETHTIGFTLNSNAMTFGSGRFVSVGRTDLGYGVQGIGQTQDGISWTYMGAPAGNLVDVAFGSGTFVAVGANMAISADGDLQSAWTLRSSIAGNWSAVCFGGTSK